ncbi:MAG: hypothetical protein ACU0BB_02975 [Paracoccaceae bacterium]
MFRTCMGLAIVLTTSACFGGPDKGKGFTGIGAEPQGVTNRQQVPGGYSYQPSPNETVTVRRAADGRLIKTYDYSATNP